MFEILAEPETWVAVAFVIFLGVLVKLGVPGMIVRALDDRSARIKAELDEAARLRREAEEVLAQYRLLTEHLGVKHLKLIIGQSMGGMHAWMWGEMYPDAMDVLVPMGSQPVAMSGRNWVLRRMMIDAIKADPA